MDTKGRIIYADVLRIIATVAVIVFHVCTDRWQTAYNNPTEWHTINFFVSELRWCVPMFFMLSGMNFLNPERSVTFGKIFKKSLPRLLCALIFWSILYKSMAVLTNLITGAKPITSSSIIDIFTTFIFEPSWFHLWFLYPLIGLYILVPVLRVFTANTSKKTYLYLLILYVIFGTIFPFLLKDLGFYTPFSIKDFNAFTGYFLAGYFFYRYDLNKKERIGVYILGFLSAIGLLLVSVLSASSFSSPTVLSVFTYDSVLVALMTLAIFIYMKQVLGKVSLNDKLQKNKYIITLSSCSFGIYLVHAIFLSVFQIIGFNTGSINSVIAILLISTVIFILSLVSTLIIKKIPVLNKYII